MKNDVQGHPDVCRIEYTPVSDGMKDVIRYLKLNTNQMLHNIRLLQDKQDNPEIRRLLALGYTTYEEACSWTVKALTSEGIIEAYKAPPQPPTAQQSSVELKP